MPVSLDKINLEAGESIIVDIGHSGENSIHIFCGTDGYAVIASPMNNLRRCFLLGNGELAEISKERRKEFIKTLR